MIYDIIKILKKCLKFWYVFVITGVIALGALFVSNIPLSTYQGEFKVYINSINQKKIMKENGNLEYYYYLTNAIIDKINTDYLKDINNKVCSTLNVSGDNLTISITLDDNQSGNPIKVVLSHTSKDVADKVSNFLKQDLSAYIQTLSDEIIPDSYLTGEYALVYNEATPNAVLTRMVINFGLIVVIIMIFEVFVIGMFVLKKNIILFDDEIKTLYKKDVLVKNYTKSMEELNAVLTNRFSTATVIIAESNSAIKDIVDKRDIKCIDINNDKAIKETFLNDNNVIIEVVKDKTEINTINKILDTVKLNNVKDVYFVTRYKEKGNESIVNK